MREGPVVVCVLSRLPTDPAAVSPRASVFALAAETPDERSYRLGTGAARPDVVAALAARAKEGKLLDAPGLAAIAEHAEYERGDANDFATEKTVARCSVHVIVSLEDVASGGDRAAVALGAIEELVGRELPFFVHAIVDGSEPAVFDAVSVIASRLGDKGALATLSGSEVAFGEDVSAPGIVTLFGAIVTGHEGPQSADAEDAIRSFLRDGGTGPSLPAIRVGGYRGARGSLEAEFGGAAPAWTWRSEDVVIVAVSAPRRLFGLVSLLIGTGLPDEVAQRIALRGRPVLAFDPSRIAATSPIGPLPVPAAVDTTATASLLEMAAARGTRCASIADPRHAVLGTFTFDGDRPLPPEVVVERRIEDGPWEAAVACLRADPPALLVVTADPPGSPEALGQLADTVVEQSGALVIVVQEPSVAVVAGFDPSLFPAGGEVTSARLFEAASMRLGLGAP